MNWQIQESPVYFKADTVGNLGTIHSFSKRKVLYRSDTTAPLSVVRVMHQLAVTGKQAADVSVLLGGQHLEIHRVERDESTIARLVDLERLS